MSEFHVQVVRLGEIKPLENSDFLGITEVYGAGGYPCIVKRGDFKPGELAVYIPVDSVVPDTAQFNFLAPAQKVPGADGANSRLPVGSVPERYRRIVAKRLRGTFSMGLRVLVIYDGVLVTALPLEARRKPPVIRPQKRCPYCRIREHARNRGVRPPPLPACH